MKMTNKKIGYLLYSKRSLTVDFRSYAVLFISIICMVVMSCNIMIYNASLSKGENDTVIKKYGEYHVVVNNVDNVNNDKINTLEYIKRTYDFPVLSSVANPNEQSSLKTAKLSAYSTEMSGLQLNIVNGNYPNTDEIMVSEKVSRAFSLLIGDSVDFYLNYAGTPGVYSFKISGIFDGCEGLDDYILLSDETKKAILDFPTYYLNYSYDKFILFDTDFKPYINKYTDSVLKLAGNATLKDENGFSTRTDYMNNEYVNLKKFYEKSGFAVTLLLSIIPAAVCIFIFAVLDVSKSDKDLSTLSMIGTTSSQFFGILISKYTVIYAAAFPIGVILSCLLMYILTLFTQNINTADDIYISFSVSLRAVVILFVICYAVLCAVTYLVSKKTSSTSYSDSVSLMKDMNNVFVRRTSLGLLSEKHRKVKLGLTFLARNRKINLMFSCVIGIIFAVFFYFVLLITQNVGNNVISVTRGDYTFVADELLQGGDKYVSDSAVSQLKGIDNVKSVDLYYSNRGGVSIFIDGDKHVSKPQTSSIATLEKLYSTDVLLISDSYENASTLYGEYVKSGELENIYNSNSVALFVHTWQDSDSYFRAGDTVRLKTVGVNEYKNYTVGAVIYIEADEYENRDVVRILTSSDTFFEFTAQTSADSVSITMDELSDEQRSETELKLLQICRDEKLTMQKDYEIYSTQVKKATALNTFYVSLAAIIFAILIALPYALTVFLLRSRKNTVKTMHMLGCGSMELFSVFGVEYFCSGILSSLIGSVLSGVIYICYRTVSNITYTRFYIGSFASVFAFSAIFVCTLVCVTVPCIAAYVYFKKSRFDIR